jgi:hypothetical protein
MTRTVPGVGLSRNPLRDENLCEMPLSALPGKAMNQTSAVLAIKRDLNVYAWLTPLRIIIDGGPVGQVGPNRTAEFNVAAGEHVVTVTLRRVKAVPIIVKVGVGDRVEIVCTSNQPALHPWHVHACLVLLLSPGALIVAEFIFPQAGPAIGRVLLIELLFALVFGPIGASITLWRIIKSNAWRRVLYLTSARTADELRSF